MRLTDEKIADVKEYLARSMKVTASSLIPQLSKYGLDLIDIIEALQQENEQLRAQLDEWKYEVKCHMDEVAARDKEIERLKAQVDTLSATVNMLAPDEIGKECRHIEALRKAREEAQNALDNYELVGEHEYDISEHLQIALAAIDKVIGGKEDA